VLRLPAIVNTENCTNIICPLIIRDAGYPWKQNSWPAGRAQKSSPLDALFAAQLELNIFPIASPELEDYHEGIRQNYL
jgi:hypothetical protein